MDETKAGDMTQHASSIADPEQKFRHTIRHGSKIQVTTYGKVLVQIYHMLSIVVFYFADLPCNSL